MKNKEKLLKAYNEYGLTDTSKLTGLKRYDVIKMLEIPFDLEIASVLLSDLLRDKKLPKVDNSTDTYVYDDVWYIETKHRIEDGLHGLLNTMATPFWDGTNIIPVDSDNMVLLKDSDASQKHSDVDIHRYSVDDDQPTEFKNLEELLIWYRDVYLPFVNKSIESHAKDFIEEYRNNF